MLWLPKRVFLQEFKDIIDCLPPLFSTLQLGEKFEGKHLEAMIQRVHKHGAVETFVAHVGSPWVEIILSSLLASNILAGLLTVLTEACLDHTGDASIKVLGQFHSLTRLELGVTSSCAVIQLHCLQHLPHLFDLMLVDGKFADLDTLGHLTSLVVKSCGVQANETAGLSHHYNVCLCQMQYSWTFTRAACQHVLACRLYT